MMHILRSLIALVLFTVPAFAQSWTAPRTWVANEVVTASIMNAHVRDNLTVLRAGGFAVTSQAQGDLLCASSSSQFARIAGAAAGSFLAGAGTTTCPTYAGTEFYINDTSNAFVTIGVTINQAGNDDSIFEFKSSDVAHGMTTVAETNTWFQAKKYVGADGGALLIGYSEVAVAFTAAGRSVTGDTAKSASAVAPVVLLGHKKSGTTVAAMGANENVVAFINDSSTILVSDAEGDLWVLGNLMLEETATPPGVTLWATPTDCYISCTHVLGTPSTWFVIEDEGGNSYRVPGYTP